MQPFQADVVTRGKLVQIRGSITRRQSKTARFLKNYREGYQGLQKDMYQDTYVRAETLQYTGNELGTSALCTLAIVGTQTYILFAFSSSIAYELAIILTSLYTFTFSCLLNFKKQMFIQLGFLVVSIILALLAMLLGIFDSYASFGVVSSVLMCLIGRGACYCLQSYYSQEVTVTFVFQSNLIIFQYLCWKGYQTLLGYFDIYSFQFSSLILTIIALGIINTLKTYNLFDYQIIQVIKNFQQNQEAMEEEKSQSPMAASQSISVFIKQNNTEESVSHEQDRVKENEVQERGTEGAAKEESNDSVLKLKNVEEISADKQAEEEEQIDNYQSKQRIIVAFVTFIVSAVCAAVPILNYNSQTSATFKSQVLYYLVAVARTTLLLMTCQYQKQLHSQQKDAFNYISIFMCDASWICLSGVLMQMPSLLSLSTEQAIVISLTPLLVIKLFNHFSRAVHSKLDNGRYASLVLLCLLPLQVRELLIVQNYQSFSYIIDGVIVMYSVIVLLFIGCKDEVLYFLREVKTLLSSKKNRLKIFQKLKTVRYQYENLIQNYLFFHVFYMNIIYYFIDGLSYMLTAVYYIIYLAPLLLYSGGLINCHTYAKEYPEHYKPSFTNIAAVLGAAAYVVVAYLGILSSSQSHEKWSFAVLLNVIMFVLALQGEKMAVVYLSSYSVFLRGLIITTLFLLIYFPFIVMFSTGYFFTSFSESYLYYYAIGGFLYIWFLITLVGLSTHWILNLTEKSKKELFIAQYMEAEMKKINMKQNMEKVLMISNMYEMLSYKSEDLLNYLKNQKHMTVLIRKEKEVEHDYELVEPEDRDKRRLSIIAKPINSLQLAMLYAGGKKETEEGREEDEEDNSNPVLNFFKEKDRNKIEIVIPMDVNNNLVQIKRLAARAVSLPREMKRIEATQAFKEMQVASNQQIGETVARLFVFLAEPSKTLSRDTFAAFLQMVTREKVTTQDGDRFYDKFSHNSLMDEYKFKNFLLDYVDHKYDHHENNFHTSLRTFCCRELVPMLLANFQPLKYYLNRKKIAISDESSQIWLHDKTEQDENSQFTMARQRELRKKAKLLKRAKERKTVMIQQDEHHSNAEEGSNIEEGARKNTVKIQKKQQKDKIFLKPENIYSILVNALIECYLYYQKESQNFKIKTIKFNLSNVLQLVIKINDIVFVFGYTTIYVFIAYYNESYESSTPFLSYVNFQILLVLASALVLVYIALIMYHKKDFETGTLGMDQNHRSLDFKSFKFWTKTIMFMLGSGLANYVIAIGLNSWICDQSTDTLFNFSDVSCFTKTHYAYMLAGLMILVIYWPLSVITYPFNTAMDRNLEIKYKVEYEVLYLQVKFMINGFNTLLNPFPFQTEQLIGSILKVFLCSILAIFYYRMQPCSYELLNMIEGKIYILLAILSFSGALCYFIGLLYSVVATGSLLLIYLIYFVYITIKSYSQLKNENEDDEIIQDIIKNQKIKIEIIRQNNDDNKQNEECSAANLQKAKPQPIRNLTRNKKNQNVGSDVIPSQTIYYNNSLQIVGSSSNAGGSHLF